MKSIKKIKFAIKLVNDLLIIKENFVMKCVNHLKSINVKDQLCVDEEVL